MDNVHITSLLLPLLSCSVLCTDLPAPVNLVIYSHHFVHLLKWEAAPGTPEGVSYSVNYRLYSLCCRNETWMVVQGCVELRFPLECNLTEVFSDPSESYYTSVTARKGSQTSPTTTYGGFQPRKQTVLEPPHLTVSPCNKSICVQLHAPSEKLVSVYNAFWFKYILYVFIDGKFEFSKETEKLNTVILENLVPGHQYCVNVSIKDYNTSDSAMVCASTTKDSSSVQDALISVAMCLMTVGSFVSVGVLFLSGFCCLRTQLPIVLGSLKSKYPMQLLTWPTTESLCVVSVESNIPKDVQRGEERDEEVEGEDEDEEEVAYEKLGRQISTYEETLDTALSSGQPSPEVPCKTLEDGTCGPESKNPTSPLHQPKPFLSPAPTVTPPWRTGFQVTPNGPRVALSSDELLKNELSFLEHEPRDEEMSADEEPGINVNLFSLTLGGCVKEEQSKEQKTRNAKISKMPVSSFLEIVPENATDVQRTHFRSSDRDVTHSEEEEAEEEEDESDFCYMKRS